MRLSRSRREGETPEEFDWNTLTETLKTAIKGIYEDNCPTCEHAGECLLEPRCKVLTQVERTWTETWGWKVTAVLFEGDIRELYEIQERGEEIDPAD